MMNEPFVEHVYEIIGDLMVYSGYFILVPFLLRWKRMVSPPYHFYFINLIISMIFDGLSMYFHYTKTNLFYFDIITPFYAINNIVFWGLFLTYHLRPEIKKYVWLSIIISSVVLLIIYLNVAFEELYPLGYLLQSLIMIIFVLTAIKSVFLPQIKITNRKSFLIICVSLLAAFLTSLFVNVLLKSMMEVSQTFMHLFFGIKNLVWLIANVLAAYAIFLAVPTKKLLFQINQHH